MPNLGLSAIQSLRAQPERIAFISSELSITYNDFANIVYAFTCKMHQNKIGRGSLVGLMTTDPRVAIAAALASQILGAAWVEVTNEALTTKDFKITHVLCQHGDESKIKHNNIVVIDVEWAPNPSSEYYFNKIPNKDFSSPQKIARVLQSSGTTGKRKFMLVKAGDEYNRLSRFSRFMEPSETVLGCLFSPLSVPGFNSRLRVIMGGGTCIEVGISQYIEKGVNIVYGSPHQLRTYLDIYGNHPRQKIPLAAMSGGRPSNALVNDLLKSFDNVCITYGSSEFGTVGVATITSPEENTNELTLINDRFMSVEVVNKSGQRLPEGKEGILRMRNDIELPIYLPKELNKGRNGWFYPGDLGVMKKNRKFFVNGRVGDVINIRGNKLNALDLDDVVQSIDGVEDGYCFVAENRLGDDAIFFIVKITDGIDSALVLKKLRKIVGEQFGAPAQPETILISKDVPRTSTGKPVRHTVASKFMAKKLPINMET